MNKIIAAGLVCLGGIACAGPTAAQESGTKSGAVAKITLVGNGSGPMEVRDSEGNVLEIYDPSDVQLNVPSHAVMAREKAYRDHQRGAAQDFRDRKAEERRVEEGRAAEAEALAQEQRKVDEEAAQVAAAEEAARPLNPYRVRGKTIRRRLLVPEPVDPLWIYPYKEHDGHEHASKGPRPSRGSRTFPSRFDSVEFPDGRPLGQTSRW